MFTDPRDPNAGSAELIDSLNLTTTPDGCLEKIAPFVTALTHSAPITNISAGSRFIYQDGIDTKEWNGTDVATLAAVMDGPIAHTPLDVRVSNGSVYKSIVSGLPLLAATLGDTSNLPDRDVKPYYAQPLFKQAFEYEGHIYSINPADSRFLQYSLYAHYDVWAIGDDHIGHISPILQAGAIKGGGIVCLHESGVSVYVGTNMSNFVKKFYPCSPIDGTLYSGFIDKALAYGHIFLCKDGVYLVDASGAPVNLTLNSMDRLDVFNSSYNGSIVSDGKYLAFGDTYAIEYDFLTKTFLKRSSFGVTSTTSWDGTAYYAVGSNIVTLGTEIDTTDDFGCSLTLPYSDWSASGTKSIEALYFTGTLNGDVLFTATDQTGKSWELEVSEEWVNVSDKRIKTPKGMMGNHVSLKIECTSGSFRLEELRAEISGSKRSK
jgi:hypothetical protein